MKTTIKAVLRRARGMLDETALLLKLKSAMRDGLDRQEAGFIFSILRRCIQIGGVVSSFASLWRRQHFVSRSTALGR